MVDATIIYETALDLEIFLDEKNIGYKRRFAQTGTRYYECVAVSGNDGDNKMWDFKIRIADHGDAYGTSDYTIDGFEGTLEGCINWISRELTERFPLEN